MKNKKVISLLSFLMIISGCSVSNTSSTINSNTSSSKIENVTSSSNKNSSSNNLSTSSSSSLSSSSEKINYVDLDVAYLNTYKNYEMKYNVDYDLFLEMYSDVIFYRMFSQESYIVLESDPQFIHSFSSYRLNDENADTSMEVYGRVGMKEDLKYFEENNFFSIVDFYIPKFTKKSNNLWEYQSSTLGSEYSDYFQMNSLKYCNILQFEIGKDGRIETFNLCEKGIKGAEVVFSIKFSEMILEENSMYNNWKNAGAIVNDRIIDYKQLYQLNNKVVSLYNDEIVDFEAVVVSKDSDGNLYVANKMSNKENTGIKLVQPKNNAFNVCDVVNVRGKIATNNYIVTIEDAEVTSTGETVEFAPIFSEEIAVNYYGGGTYAAQAFALYPYYSGSVYSTYAYVNEVASEVNNNGDTIIDVVCPNYVDGTNYFHMEVILPANMDSLTKQNLYNQFLNAGLFENGGYELSLENFVIEFVPEYYYHVKLLATESSKVSKRLNASEAVEEYVGLPSFPLLGNGETPVSFRFGSINEQYLEDTYGLETHNTSGVYMNYSALTEDDFTNYLETIKVYGAELFDVVRDEYRSIHYIFTYNDAVIDLEFIDQGEDVLILNVWVYQGEILRCLNIKEKLDAAIGEWFDSDNFLLFNEYYDKDYSLFKLYDYANTSYTLENPLYCVALDTQEPILMDYCRALVQELGYSQYKVNNRPYTYTCRGQLHYVFYKDGVMMDVSSYPTTDYTYTGHDEFQYRLEVLIYQGNTPIEVPHYKNLDVLCQKAVAKDEAFRYEINLPEDAIVEVWNDLEDYKLSDVEYGYGSRNEAFVYSEDVDNLYQLIQEGLEASGYEKNLENSNFISYSKTSGAITQYIYLLREKDKGYVRIMHDLAGMDFNR